MRGLRHKNIIVGNAIIFKSEIKKKRNERHKIFIGGSSVVTGDSDRSKRELSVRESGINSGGAYAAMARGSMNR